MTLPDYNAPASSQDKNFFERLVSPSDLGRGFQNIGGWISDVFQSGDPLYGASQPTQSPASQGFTGYTSPAFDVSQRYPSVGPAEGAANLAALTGGNFTPDINGLTQQLEQGRQALIDARNAAVRKNGSAAAAPYNRAIANIDQQIAATRVSVGQVDQLYQGVDARTQKYFNQAAQYAGKGTEHIIRQAQLSGESKRAAGDFFTHIEQQTGNLMKNVDAGGHATQVAMTGMDQIENALYDSIDQNQVSASRIAAAADEVATTAAKYAGAKTAADLERKRIVIQLNLQEQLDKMAQQRADLIARRNAAVAAARRATIDQFGANTPLGQDGYATAITHQFITNMAKASGVTEVQLQDFLDSADPIIKSGQITGLYQAKNLVAGMVTSGAVASSDADWIAKTIFEASRTYQSGVDYYNNNISTADYQQLPPNSLDRANAVYASVTNNNTIITPKEAAAIATDPSYHQVYTGGHDALAGIPTGQFSYGAQ